MNFKTGERVRVKSVPAKLPADDLDTSNIFAMCVGRVFPVADVTDLHVQLEVGEVAGQSPWTHTIWIEPEHLERAGN